MTTVQSSSVHDASWRSDGDDVPRDLSGEPDEASDQQHSVHDRLDVTRLFEEPLLRGVVLLSGTSHLRREVTWCLPWDGVTSEGRDLRGAVVVASASDLPATGTARAIRALAAEGAAAILIAGGAAENGILREEHGLVIAVLPPSVGFVPLNKVVAELALAKETHVLRYGLTVHRTLAELLYRGAGLAALARQLSRLAASPVAILDPHGRRLAYECERRDCVLRDPEGLVAAVVVEAELAPLDTPTAHPSQATMKVTVEVADDRLTLLIRPIVLGGRHDGWILLVEPSEGTSWHEHARHEVLIEQATMIVGSEMLRLHSVEAAEERARGDFVHALLHGRLSNPQELAARAAYYDMDTGARYGVVVARQVDTAGSTESQHKMQQLIRVASGLLERHGQQPMLTLVGDVLALVLRTESNTLAGGTAQVAEFAHALHRELSRLDSRPLTVTYGRPAGGAGRIVESYREARLALGVCERLLLSDVAGYGELRVFSALLELAGSQRGQVFAREVLEPLRKADRRGGGDLEQAVVTYVACGGNLNAAARKMSLHRNTMLYKLDRAARALNMDLREAEDRFTFWLAYRVDLLGDVQAQIGRELAPRA